MAVTGAARKQAGLYYDKGGALFNVRHPDFGSKGDSVTDDTASITAAVTACIAAGGGVVYFPPGIYKTTSNIVVAVTDPHIGIKLVGMQGSSYIKPAAGVTIAFTFSCVSTDANGLASRFIAEGITLDGSQTTGAVGVLVGDNASHLSAYMVMRDFEIYGFHGVGARGLYIKDLVGGLFDNVYVDRCTTDLYINPSDGALPTMLSFRFCQFREADGNGIEIYNGYRINFSQTVVESNFGRGVWVVPPPGTPNILWLEFDGLWCEGNCRNDSSQYQVHIDGSVAGGGTLELRVANGNWTGPSKSIYLKNVHNVILDNIYPGGTAGNVLIDAGVNGFARNWPWNQYLWPSVVVNNSPNTFIMADAGYGKTVIDPATGSVSVISGTPDLGSAGNRFGKSFFSSIASYYSQPNPVAGVSTPDFSGPNLIQINATTTLTSIANPSPGGDLAKWLIVQIRNTSGGAITPAWGSKFRVDPAIAYPATGKQRSYLFFRDPGLDTYNQMTSLADVPN